MQVVLLVDGYLSMYTGGQNYNSGYGKCHSFRFHVIDRPGVLAAYSGMGLAFQAILSSSSA